MRYSGNFPMAFRELCRGFFWVLGKLLMFALGFVAVSVIQALVWCFMG